MDVLFEKRGGTWQYKEQAATKKGRAKLLKAKLDTENVINKIRIGPQSTEQEEQLKLSIIQMEAFLKDWWEKRDTDNLELKRTKLQDITLDYLSKKRKEIKNKVKQQNYLFDQWQWWFYNLVVDPAFQGKGVSTFLIKKMLENTNQLAENITDETVSNQLSDNADTLYIESSPGAYLKYKMQQWKYGFDIVILNDKYIESKDNFIKCGDGRKVYYNMKQLLTAFGNIRGLQEALTECKEYEEREIQDESRERFCEYENENDWFSDDNDTGQNSAEVVKEEREAAEQYYKSNKNKSVNTSSNEFKRYQKYVKWYLKKGGEKFEKKAIVKDRKLVPISELNANESDEESGESNVSEFETMSSSDSEDDVDLVDENENDLIPESDLNGLKEADTFLEDAEETREDKNRRKAAKQYYESNKNKPVDTETDEFKTYAEYVADYVDVGAETGDKVEIVENGQLRSLKDLNKKYLLYDNALNLNLLWEVIKEYKKTNYDLDVFEKYMTAYKKLVKEYIKEFEKDYDVVIKKILGALAVEEDEAQRRRVEAKNKELKEYKEARELSDADRESMSEQETTEYNKVTQGEEKKLTQEIKELEKTVEKIKEPTNAVYENYFSPRQLHDNLIGLEGGNFVSNEVNVGSKGGANEVMREGKRKKQIQYREQLEQAGFQTVVDELEDEFKRRRKLLNDYFYYEKLDDFVLDKVRDLKMPDKVKAKYMSRLENEEKVSKKKYEESVKRLEKKETKEEKKKCIEFKKIWEEAKKKLKFTKTEREIFQYGYTTWNPLKMYRGLKTARERKKYKEILDNWSKFATEYNSNFQTRKKLEADVKTAEKALRRTEQSKKYYKLDEQLKKLKDKKARAKGNKLAELEQKEEELKKSFKAAEKAYGELKENKEFLDKNEKVVKLVEQNRTRTKGLFKEMLEFVQSLKEWQKWKRIYSMAYVQKRFPIPKRLQEILFKTFDTILKSVEDVDDFNIDDFKPWSKEAYEQLIVNRTKQDLNKFTEAFTKLQINVDKEKKDDTGGFEDDIDNDADNDDDDNPDDSQPMSQKTDREASSSSSSSSSSGSDGEGSSSDGGSRSEGSSSDGGSSDEGSSNSGSSDEEEDE